MEVIENQGFRVVAPNVTRPSEDLLECIVCPKRNGNYTQFLRKNIGTHSTRLKHISCLAEFRTQINEDNPNFTTPPLSGPSHASNNPQNNEDEEMMLSELWRFVDQDIVVTDEEEAEGDSLETLLQALASHDLISCELPKFAAAGSSELPDEFQEDNEEGTEEGMFNLLPMSTELNKVQPQSLLSPETR
ncbi:hypothetical protein PM082_005085 [Marasmius tenuissimus]|nr:hypothetical protein PM082_005085 [Marasmius tenuissimus]